jgi:hypothetical protein
MHRAMWRLAALQGWCGSRLPSRPWLREARLPPHTLVEHCHQRTCSAFLSCFTPLFFCTVPPSTIETLPSHGPLGSHNTFNLTSLVRTRHSPPTETHERKEAAAHTVTMRRGVTIFVLVTVVVLGFAVHSVWTLLGLLVATGREDAILRGELPAPNSGTINQRPQLIPKIIHQTYINESIPAHWKEPQQSCLNLHPDYEYKVRRTSIS